jgi:hypothetical protein
MSASSKPTDAPSAASASARLTATVDLPTPPFPDATEMMLRTPGTSCTPPCTECATTFQLTCALTCPTPGNDRNAVSICSRTFCSWLFAG